MSSANCTWHIPSVKGLDDAAVTVGRHLVLRCNSNLGVIPDLSSYSLKPSDPPTQNIRLFSIKNTDAGSFEVDLTFYQANEYLPNQIILTNGQNNIDLIGDSIKVESVLQPPADGKPQEAYKAILPLEIGTPVLYYVLLFFSVAAFVTWLWVYLKRINYYRQLKENLKSYSSPLTPEDQFYKSLRAAEKKDYPIEDVERALRVYVLRQYSLPMFELSDKKVLRYFRYNFPKYKKARQELQRVLQEFENFRGPLKNDLAAKSAFVKKLYKFVQLTKEGIR